MNEDKNSMCYWFPLVKDLSIPQPRTVIVEVEDPNGLHHPFTDYIDDPSKFPEDIFTKLRAAGRNIGYPLFLRTDQISGKHGVCGQNWWIPYVEKEEDLLAHILCLAEESAIAGFVGLPIKAFVFREMLELTHKFHAFSEMPVAKERRYFVKDGKMVCHHPYWIQDAIEFWCSSEAPVNWKEELKKLNFEHPYEIEILTNFSEEVSKVVNGYWSVDFAYSHSTTNGIWYLIDMALGEDSWHPECSRRKTSSEVKI